MKKVLVGGVFDVLHAGHEFFLRKTKEYGDYLIVVVANDKTAARKRDTIRNQAERVENLEKLGIADEVVAGGEGDFLELVDEIRPDIVAFGHDQDSLLERLKAGLEERGIEIIKVEDVLERERYSSTNMLKND